MVKIYSCSLWTIFFIFYPFCDKLLQIVNGPEVLNKYLGETEKNVRDLFADAENDQRARGKGDIAGVFLGWSFGDH